MPEAGVKKLPHENMLTEDEFINAIEAAAELGVRKIRFTGGEPLVKKNILSICARTAKIKGIEEICMTTNAIRLAEYAKPLREAGVQRLNISLDTLDPEKYAYITRRGQLSDAISGIETALNSGFSKIKINAVLIGGFNDDEIPALADLTRKYPVDMRFIEFMPMGADADFSKEAFIPCDTVLKRLPEIEKEEKLEGVARLYHLPNAQGNIGLISPLSNHFCGTCNRIRLMADGMVKPCLHSALQFNLRGLEKQQMKEILIEAIQAKPQKHGALSSDHRSPAGRGMSTIGG